MTCHESCHNVNDTNERQKFYCIYLYYNLDD